jgi:hypothetical protein
MRIQSKLGFVAIIVTLVACGSSSNHGTDAGIKASTEAGSDSSLRSDSRPDATGSAGTGGSAGSGGTAGSGGSAGGAGSGGTAGSGGSAGSAGSGGTAGSGGSAGSAGSGGIAGSGGSAGSAGSGGSSADGGSVVGSPGCGTTSSLTFGTDPNEDPNATQGSGNEVGTGVGGWTTITGPGQIGSDSTANGGRGFDVRLPDNYDKHHPYWLIFGFHWRGGNSAQVDNGGSNGYWWAYYGMQRKSNNGAIFVAPNGIGGGWANSGGEDLTFTDDMVALIERNYCVDTTHIITMGFSWGAGMSYEIACARSKVFHAAVLYEAGELSGCDPDPQGNTNDPIAFMQIEGLTDTTLPISGAYPVRDKFVQNNSCTPLDSSLDNPGSSAEPSCPCTDGCPSGSNCPNSNYLNPGGHICTNYSGCSAGHPLRWCVSQSAHGPGPIDGNPSLYNPCATPPNTCSPSCPCTWTPDDVWSWLTTAETPGMSFQTPNATK